MACHLEIHWVTHWLHQQTLRAAAQSVVALVVCAHIAGTKVAPLVNGTVVISNVSELHEMMGAGSWCDSLW